MTTGVKLLLIVVVVVILVAAPTQAAGLLSDLFAGIMQFVRALG